jgi:hypothetical protein
MNNLLTKKTRFSQQGFFFCFHGILFYPPLFQLVTVLSLPGDKGFTPPG